MGKTRVTRIKTTFSFGQKTWKMWMENTMHPKYTHSTRHVHTLRINGKIECDYKPSKVYGGWKSGA